MIGTAMPWSTCTVSVTNTGPTKGTGDLALTKSTSHCHEEWQQLKLQQKYRLFKNDMASALTQTVGHPMLASEPLVTLALNPIMSMTLRELLILSDRQGTAKVAAPAMKAQVLVQSICCL